MQEIIKSCPKRVQMWLQLHCQQFLHCNINVPEILFIPHLYSSFPKHSHRFLELQPQSWLQELEWFTWKLFAHCLDFSLKPADKKAVIFHKGRPWSRKALPSFATRVHSNFMHQLSFCFWYFV